ncbi:BsuBI/PstI family type II restriction endonuclease [Bifidobacterium cuniculi]|uniref:Type II restriction-modification system restriction subunit n=1 Tax=Bifidobacterium cuniculi TaxID=1688 RepID=A0A087AYP3_9BIFI|nr:BsuBI/PstI family type II restriction endonuclease [Bifidobacterium cuniculi]KFI63893.1 Type II restriction-modification system restriction subunit [Bifidobacterium cuniculi]
MVQGKLIEQALEALRSLEVGKNQLNERSAMTLLALLRLREGDPWESATNPMMRTLDIMNWIRDEFGVEYKPNTRETIRRQSLHQFILSGFVEENADDPMRPINSPKWNYRITDEALALFRTLGTTNYVSSVEQFLANHVSYATLSAERHTMPQTPVTLPSGVSLELSAGGQSVLLKHIIEDMLPRFAPSCAVMYIDDTDHRHGAIDPVLMDRLGITLKAREKAPDLIAWDSEREWLFLAEAASTHGPINVIRKAELKELFRDQWNKVVLVSCFPDRKIMQRYLADLAWETEAWCADSPDHMVHLNGSRFMGPYQER